MQSIFRLTPVYAFVVFYYATVFNYTGSGPMWKIIVTQQNQACRENWYLNLLYLNNYIGEQNMVRNFSCRFCCLFHHNVLFSVYVAFLVSPLRLPLLHYWPFCLRTNQQTQEDRIVRTFRTNDFFNDSHLCCCCRLQESSDVVVLPS